MSTELQPFMYGERHVRTVVIDGEAWFVAVDVCGALGLMNVTEALRGLDNDEKGFSTAYTPGGEQRVSIVSRPGVFSLTSRSRKPEAKVFWRWVTHDVLPALFDRGTYTVPGAKLREREADKPAELRLEQYRAKQRRELAKQGLYQNPVTGEIALLPMVVPPDDVIAAKVDEIVRDRERKARKDFDNPYESRPEFNHSRPYQPGLGQQ